MNKVLDLVKPGEILEEEFMKPLNISQNRLANDLDVSTSRIPLIIQDLRCQTSGFACAHVLEYAPQAHHSFFYQLLNYLRYIINAIIHGRCSITADMALRLGKYFNTSPEMWINLQSHYDLELAEKNKWPQIKDRVRIFAIAS